MQQNHQQEIAKLVAQNNDFKSQNVEMNQEISLLKKKIATLNAKIGGLKGNLTKNKKLLQEIGLDQLQTLHNKQICTLNQKIMSQQQQIHTVQAELTAYIVPINLINELHKYLKNEYKDMQLNYEYKYVKYVHSKLIDNTFQNY